MDARWCKQASRWSKSQQICGQTNPGGSREAGANWSVNGEGTNCVTLWHSAVSSNGCYAQYEQLDHTILRIEILRIHRLQLVEPSITPMTAGAAAARGRDGQPRDKSHQRRTTSRGVLAVPRSKWLTQYTVRIAGLPSVTSWGFAITNSRVDFLQLYLNVQICHVYEAGVAFGDLATHTSHTHTADDERQRCCQRGAHFVASAWHDCMWWCPRRHWRESRVDLDGWMHDEKLLLEVLVNWC